MRDEDANQWVSCPRCAVILHLPTDDRIQTGAKPAGGQAGAKTPVKTEREAGRADEAANQLRKRMGKARRAYLRVVDSALWLHYVAPFLFLLGTGAGLIAAILDFNGEMYDFESTIAPANGLFWISGSFLVLAGVAAFLAALACLVGAGSLGGGKLSLWFCMVLLGGGCLCAVLTALLPDYRTTVFLAGLAILFSAWWFWMEYVGELNAILKRDEVATGAEQVLWSTMRAMAVLVPLFLFEGAMIGFTVKRPWLILFEHAPFLGVVAALSYRVGEFDSVASLALAPTGLPFALEYLNFIAGLRAVIQRRI
jgi:hypothetical protein